MENHQPHQKDLRKGRYSQTGQIYHVTTTTLSRAPIFLNFDSARCLVKILKKSDALQHSCTLAFVIMPDHFHWLFKLNEVVSLNGLMQSVKSSSAHAIGVAIWQKSYHDHAVRKEEDIHAIARYIVANPVRAGLVKSVGHYPHWDAIWW